MQTSFLVLAIGMLTATGALAAAAQPCDALQAEVDNLRARIRVLEAAVLPTVSAPPRADSILPGTAAKPAATATVVIEEPYSKTGCSRGLFKGIASARWQENALWLDLAKGQTPAEVEKLLGIEHFDERGGNNTIWHYGRCGESSRAQVLFTDGKLSDWRAPLAR